MLLAERGTLQGHMNNSMLYDFFMFIYDFIVLCCSLGDIISRLTSDTTQVSDLISQNVNLFLRSFIKAIGFFIFMFGMSWKLTLVTIMGFPYIAVVSKMYGEYYKVKYVEMYFVFVCVCACMHNLYHPI